MDAPCAYYHLATGVVCKFGLEISTKTGISGLEHLRRNIGPASSSFVEFHSA